jgi:branched-subunit amino acid ABC-type transport system permease component
MDPKLQDNTEEQEYTPNMFWEGFFYLTFFIFANIVLIPYTPKSWSFGRYYPVAMIIYGAAGLAAGMIAYRLLKNAPNWVKATIVSILYAIIIFYLVDNIERFTIPD